jgi:MFS family permease
MTTNSTPYASVPANPMRRVFGLRDFRLLFAGATTSLLGDQFALIATPWLVLQLTGDPLALGVVLALEGIPRAAFMLIGGAITDRFSPRLIMLASDSLRLILTALLAAAIFAGAVQMWMVYGFALAFGLVAGFAVPAENSIVPMIVDERDLQAGNSLMMGVTQLAGFVGPTIAGILIGSYSTSDFGVGLAFFIDAVTFAVSATTLWLIRTGSRREGTDAPPENVWDSIVAGIRHLWTDPTLRFVFLVMTAINFLMVGPLLVGIPVLADERLPEGAVAFGLLMSAYAGGNLVGYLLAGALPPPRGIVLRIILIALLGGFGAVIGAMGFLRSTWVDFGLLLALGVGNGYIGIILFTWIQRQTPQIMLGRMMSMLMFASTGLVPVSEAVSGAVSKWELTMLFVSAGVLVFLVTLWSAFHPQMKTFSQSLSTAPEA